MNALRLLAGVTLGLACEPGRTQLTNLGSVGMSVDGGTPEIELTHTFGVVPRGGSAMVSIALTNTGKDALLVTHASLLAADTGAYFVRGAVGRLEPGASRSFEVTFAPVRTGLQSARLAFEHDAAAPAALLSLSGSGGP